MEQPSERRLIADRIAAFIVANDIASPFGGEVSQSQDKGRPYDVAMSRPRVMDGVVRVYGPRFILVTLAGPMARYGDSFVYLSEQHALDFLRLLFVEHNPEAALAIPTKPRPA